ncbi:MAG: methyl-accepting chemotaxis protein [Burkholderiaceae bacterium]
MSFGNLKIGARLGLGFFLMQILLVATIGFALSAMSGIQTHLNQIVDEDNVKSFAANEMVDNFRDLSGIVSNIVMLQDEAALQEQKNMLAAAREKYGKAKKVLLGTPLNEKEKALLGKLDQSIQFAIPLVNKVVELGLQNQNMEAADVLMTQAAPAVRQAIGVIDEIVVYERDAVQTASEETKVEYTRARNLMLLLGGLAIALGALVSWFITRSITRPINRAVQVARTVASGDLTSRIEVSTTDETGHLLQALKEMNDSLIHIVGQVRTGTDAIVTASSQISAGNQDLSSRTEEQASSLEQTAASMEELTTTVKQNDGSANQANQLAQSASAVAVKGGAVVSQVVDTMASINDSSKRIADIISVIDGIAFQTNILALNAAVEAARAGEQGRGFAVVATEVRNLAQRSAAAAKEIKVLIDDSVDKVDTGSKLVAQAGVTMNEVVESVKRVTDIMSEITAASQEQSSEIEQVNHAIGHMDDVTQQNAALVEEAAAAACSLHDQADNLAHLVSVFKLDGASPAVSVSLKAASRPTPVAVAASLPTATSNVRRPAKNVNPPRRVVNGSAATESEWEEF